jgi:hypothetical protein
MGGSRRKPKNNLNRGFTAESKDAVIEPSDNTTTATTDNETPLRKRDASVDVMDTTPIEGGAFPVLKKTRRDEKDAAIEKLCNLDWGKSGQPNKKPRDVKTNDFIDDLEDDEGVQVVVEEEEGIGDETNSRS